MSPSDFFSLLGAKLKNPRWSWGSVRSNDGVVFLRVWEDEIVEHNGFKYIPIIKHSRHSSKLHTNGYRERLKHIELVKKGALCYLVMCKAVHINADQRKIKSFNENEVFRGGKFEKRDEDWWIQLLQPVSINEVMTINLAEEIPTGSAYNEGSVQKILVNQYERNSKARAICIEHWGHTCTICGFDFGQVYGETAKGFIHVHHLKQLSKIGKNYEVDPINDLRPVCPNCHAMIHQVGNCRSIEEVKKMLADPSDPLRAYPAK